jgi:putative sugar O-methyltransferase
MQTALSDSALDSTVLDQIEKMQKRLADSGYGDLGMWEQLCRKHVKLLRENGFATFKRTINFEYHQWSVRSFVDLKTLRLLGAVALRGRLPSTAVGSGIDIADALETTWTKGAVTMSRLMAYRFYAGLLWDFALTEDKLGLLQHLEEPVFGRPLPIRMGGKLVTQDLALSAIELNSIARSCDLSRVRRVAEIGAGYGRMAWLVLKSQPQLSYHIFDIPPALAVSQNYLTQCLGPDRVVPCPDIEVDPKPESGVTSDRPGTAYFHLPLQMDKVEDKAFDLFINVSSFDEMPKGEVDKYFAFIDRTLKGHLYLKGYQYNPASGWTYTKFPYPKHWKRVWSRVDPTNPLFIEQVFSVNL